MGGGGDELIEAFERVMEYLEEELSDWLEDVDRLPDKTTYKQMKLMGKVIKYLQKETHNLKRMTGLD